MNKLVIEPLGTRRKRPSPSTRLVLLGLTPGARQHKAIASAKRSRAGAFLGLRRQIHEWFVELGIAGYLGIGDEDAIFDDPSLIPLTYMTSLLRDPVYVVRDGKKKNYSGRTPAPWQDPRLTKSADSTCSFLHRTLPPTTLIVPMGKVVSRFLADFSALEREHIVLHGFPHPSGANASRHRQFLEKQGLMKRKVLEWAKVKP